MPATPSPKPSPAPEPKERWKLSFGPGAILFGVIVASIVFMLLVYVALGLVMEADPDAIAIDDPLGARFRLTTLAGGTAFAGFLLFGPSIAFGLGWLLRRNDNTPVHVLVFALVGVVLGFGVGLIIDPETAGVVGPITGVAAAAGRLAVAPFAKI